MTPKRKACTSHNGKHSWQWVKDVTFKNMRVGPDGSTAKFSRRGLFKCSACGETKYATARSGL